MNIKNYKVKKISLVFLIFFLFSAACSNPIDQTKQNELVQSNQIRIGMGCRTLTEMIGGYRAITYLYLEKKNLPQNLANSYLLMSTASKSANKNFFLCERKRIDNIRIRQRIKKHIYDYDLIKIYKDPNDMIRYVLSVSSAYTRMHILSRVNLIDYNLSRPEVNAILDEIVVKERKLLDEEAKRAEKILKEEIKKEKLNVPEDEDQKILRKKILEEINNQ